MSQLLRSAAAVLVACALLLPSSAAAKETVRLERVTEVNLLRNSGFEQPRGKLPRPDAWGPQTSLPNVRFEWDATVKRAGARSLAVDLRDDVFPHAAKPFRNGDCVQIAIDTGGQRGQRLDDDDYAFSFVPRGERLAVGVDYAPKGKRPAPRAIAAAYRAKPGGAVMEMAIPWASIGVAGPADLTTLGFSLLVSDNDGAGRKWVEWGSGIVRGKRPAEFGAFVMFPRPDAIRCAVTPADAEFNDSDYAALSLDVYALAAKRPVLARLRIENDTHAGELESPIETTAGVRSAPFMFKLAGLAPGPWRVRGEVLGADGSSLSRCDASMHVYPLLATRPCGNGSRSRRSRSRTACRS